MEKFDIYSFESILNSELNSQTISGRVLLDQFLVIDEDSRKTAAYLDHRYAPFYYHLGKHIKPENVMEIGFNLGLLSSSFFCSCKTAKLFFGFKEKFQEFNSFRIGSSNIKRKFKGKSDFYAGNVYDREFSEIISSVNWDLIFVNEETTYDKHLTYLDSVWTYVGEYGIIVADYIERHKPAKDAFFAFCESKNRKPVVFKTRYGTGLLQK
jgi:hypothetical protein